MAAFFSDGSSVTNSLVEADDASRPAVNARVMRADEAMREFGLEMHTVMKIDVDGINKIHPMASPEIGALRIQQPLFWFNLP